jgi:MFS superfamily sulfate permease-like transporter
LLLVITFATTIALGIELGLLIGLGISVFLIIQHTAFPHIALLGRLPDTNKYRDIALFKEATTIPVRSPDTHTHDSRHSLTQMWMRRA